MTALFYEVKLDDVGKGFVFCCGFLCVLGGLFCCGLIFVFFLWYHVCCSCLGYSCCCVYVDAVFVGCEC